MNTQRCDKNHCYIFLCMCNRVFYKMTKSYIFLWGGVLNAIIAMLKKAPQSDHSAALMLGTRKQMESDPPFLYLIMSVVRRSIVPTFMSGHKHNCKIFFQLQHLTLIWLGFFDWHISLGITAQKILFFLSWITSALARCHGSSVTTINLDKCLALHFNVDPQHADRQNVDIIIVGMLGVHEIM
jgi:NAD-dependent dihydropyrimidine dehydrogenase PreA subunit